MKKSKPTKASDSPTPRRRLPETTDVLPVDTIRVRDHLAPKPSYLANMTLEVISDDNQKVSKILIHGFSHQPMPADLWCDFLQALNRMTPEAEVCFTTRPPSNTLQEAMTPPGHPRKYDRNKPLSEQ